MDVSVDIVIYDGFKALEAIGSLSVFTYANIHLARRGLPGRYDVKLASVRRGNVQSDTGVPLASTKSINTLSAPHTAIIVGAWNIKEAVENAPEIVQWVEATAGRMERTAALCSEAFFLAAAGLLDAKRATTIGP